MAAKRKGTLSTKCQHCEVVFENHSDISKHFKEFHPGKLSYMICLTCLSCLTCLTSLTCLTGLTCLTSLTCLTCLPCLTWLSCFTRLTRLTRLSPLTRLTRLPPITRLTHLTRLNCLPRVTCLFPEFEPSSLFFYRAHVLQVGCIAESQKADELIRWEF